MDDRELSERLENISVKLDLALYKLGYEYDDERGFYEPEAKKGAKK